MQSGELRKVILVGLPQILVILSPLSLDNASSLIYSTTYKIDMISGGFEIWKKKNMDNYLVLIMLYPNYLFNQIILSSNSPSHRVKRSLDLDFYVSSVDNDEGLCSRQH